MDDGLVTHYMGCTGVSAINWLRHGNEYNEKSEFFYNYKFSFFCERESFTLVALSLASVYLVVLFSTWGTRFKLQSERLLLFVFINVPMKFTSFSISRYFRLFSSFSFGIPSFSLSFCFSTTCGAREL